MTATTERWPPQSDSEPMAGHEEAAKEMASDRASDCEIAAVAASGGLEECYAGTECGPV